MEAFDGDRTTCMPFLLKFSRPVARATTELHYDAVRQVNLLGASHIPAVLAGIEVKTVPPGPGED